MTAPDERRTPEEIARECCGCRICKRLHLWEGTDIHCLARRIAAAITADRQHENGGE